MWVARQTEILVRFQYRKVHNQHEIHHDNVPANNINQMISPLDLPPDPIPFQLPATQPHSGIPLANGTLGVLLWTGMDPRLRDCLHVTLGRQDYWLRVPPVRWDPAATYEAVCDHLRDLESGRAGSDGPAHWLSRPQGDGMPNATLLPIGRFRAIVLPDHPLCLVRCPPDTEPSRYMAGCHVQGTETAGGSTLAGHREHGEWARLEATDG
jgi:hypothetical protein